LAEKYRAAATTNVELAKKQDRALGLWGRRERAGRRWRGVVSDLGIFDRWLAEDPGAVEAAGSRAGVAS
jgi:hypothetical protein